MAVASFTSLNENAEGPGLGNALRQAVATRLAAAAGVTLAASESDARYVVRGGIQQVGPLVRVTARIVDTEDGAVLHAAKIDGTSDDRPTLEANVAAAVLEHVTTSPAVMPPEASGGMAARDTPRALAVLPFDDLSAGNDVDLDVDLGAAIADAVAAQVATLRSVAVVMPGDEAAWAIGGGIQRIGSLVRVTARLTDVRSGAVVTAVKVDGTVEALGDLQSRVASALLDSVRTALGAESVASLDSATGAAARRPEGRRS